ncbi:MAG TPA: YraN family protein [bacterium]|nr:YraN family protein [bacterium]
MSKVTLGKQGENWAVEQLSVNGFTILERNYRSRAGEIDIVAYKNGRLHFVEVKTRRPGELFLVEEVLTESKRERLWSTIYQYLYRHKINNDEYQLDLLLILVDRQGRPEKISLYEAM